jgi:hypothetical protein
VSDPVGKFATARRYCQTLYGNEVQDFGEDVAFIQREGEHEALGPCWVGWFVFGIGMYDVHFAKEDVRPPTEDELAKYAKRGCVRYTFTDAQDEIPRSDWWVRS